MTVVPNTKIPWDGKGKRPVLIRGMHGLGDAIHQRGPLKWWLLQDTHEFWLESSWASVYHDLMPTLNVIPKATHLRMQVKNISREIGRFSTKPIPPCREVWVTWYNPDVINKYGSILQAMAYNFRCPPHQGLDFRLPIPEHWRKNCQLFMAREHIRKPIMLYRPLIERTEWQGCAARNPQFEAYAEVFMAIRDKFFVVSIADLYPGREWISGFPMEADLEYHRAELSFEMLAALCAESALVYCSSGMAAILAQAVGTPSICMWGGFERSTNLSAGAKLTPTLTISPVHPACGCWRDDCTCDKTIDIPQAIEAAGRFIDQHVFADGIATVA